MIKIGSVKAFGDPVPPNEVKSSFTRKAASDSCNTLPLPARAWSPLRVAGAADELLAASPARPLCLSACSTASSCASCLLSAAKRGGRFELPSTRAGDRVRYKGTLQRPMQCPPAAEQGHALNARFRHGVAVGTALPLHTPAATSHPMPVHCSARTWPACLCTMSVQTQAEARPEQLHRVLAATRILISERCTAPFYGALSVVWGARGVAPGCPAQL